MCDRWWIVAGSGLSGCTTIKSQMPVRWQHAGSAAVSDAGPLRHDVGDGPSTARFTVGAGHPVGDGAVRPRSRGATLGAALLLALVVFLLPVSGATAAPAVSGDSGPVSVQLTSGVPVTGRVTSSAGVAYTFTAVAGRHVTLAITSPMVPSGSLQMQVLDNSDASDGVVGFNTGPVEFDFTPTPAQAGTTTVLITPSPATATGNFTLTYATDIPGALTSVKPVTTHINIAGQRTAYTFDAVAGHHVTLAITKPMVPTGQFNMEAVDASRAVDAGPIGFNRLLVNWVDSVRLV